MCVHMIFVQMLYFYKYVSMQVSRAVVSGSGYIYVCQYTYVYRYDVRTAHCFSTNMNKCKYQE